MRFLSDYISKLTKTKHNMKHLNKVLTIALLALFCQQVNAQSIGIKGGLNLVNVLEEDDDDTYSNDYSMNAGFHLGATVDVPINDFLTFEPGLLLTTKGYRVEEKGSGGSLTGKLKLYYFDIPLMFKASHDLGGGLKMFGALGPYFGLGLSGKFEINAESQDDKSTLETDIKFGDNEDNDDLRRFDSGLAFGAGVEYNSILFGITYDLGLANMSAYQNDGYTIKNRSLKFSVGYRFSK